jgi:hypothetical protein
MKILLRGAVGIGCILLPFTAFGQRYITGELSGIYPADEYVITGNIHVLPRTSLRFEPGSTLRFENFTGITVHGELICKGTILRPIRFTSSRDMPNSRIMPEAFDWNGITVTAEAINVCLEYCTISYSTTGLEIALNATPVLLKEVTFHHSGSSSLIRERELINADDNVPVSFQWSRLPLETLQRRDSTIASPAKNSRAIPAQPPLNWKKPVMYSTGGLTIAAGLFAGAAYGLAWKYGSEYEDADTERTTSLARKRDDWLTASAIGLAVASISAVGFTLTYIF